MQFNPYSVIWKYFIKLLRWADFIIIDSIPSKESYRNNPSASANYLAAFSNAINLSNACIMKS